MPSGRAALNVRRGYTDWSAQARLEEDLRAIRAMGVKLATRMHRRPRLVLEAYTRRRYHGNLLELFEPGHARLWAPHLIENDRFPADWFERTSTCAYRCDTCGYCARVLARTL